jgi:4,5-dihydroxyphthalate decarboxylase
MVERLPTILRTVLANSPLSAPLRSGERTSADVTLDFVDVSPVHKAFAPMVRQQAYDLSELAIVTALQAIAFGRRIVLLPAVVASRFQRGCIIAYRPRGVLTPQELPGKRIGVRSYTQTTGMWVRAHLVEDYGLSTQSMQWLTHDPAHVEQYKDPSFVHHMAGDKSLPDMLRDGDIDAAILGNDLPTGDEFAPVIADAAARDRAWSVQHGFVPINHMLAASGGACERHPNAVKAAYELLRELASRTPSTSGEPRKTVFGFDALSAPVAWVIDACVEQGLLSRRLSIDEVFGPAEKILGASPD